MRSCLLLAIFSAGLAGCADGSASDDGGDGGSDTGGNDTGGTGWPVVLELVDHEDPLTDEGGDNLFYFEVTQADASYELDRLTYFVERDNSGSFGVRILLDDDDGVLDPGDTGHTLEEGSRFGTEHIGQSPETRLVADWADPDAPARDLFRGDWSAQ